MRFGALVVLVIADNLSVVYSTHSYANLRHMAKMLIAC